MACFYFGSVARLDHCLQTINPDAGVESQSFEGQLRDFKVKLATQAIHECNGNKTNAARRLNISRAYLHRLVRSVPEELEIA